MTSAPRWRVPSAIRSASKTSVVRMWLASCQPTTRRLKTSMTNAKYSTPAQQRRRVKSHTQSRSGASAVKSRSTRSAGRAALGSETVVRHGRPRRLAPRMPCSRISRWTWQRGARSPALSSAFQVLRYP